MNMLMEIDPLPTRGSLVMTMAMISPSRREVSPAEQLCQSSRLVPPRFRLVAAEFLPESLLMIFFLGQKTSYSRRWTPEACQGAHEAGVRAQGGRARPPPSWMVGGPPQVLLSSNFFYSKTCSHEVSGLLELCKIGL